MGQSDPCGEGAHETRHFVADAYILPARHGIAGRVAQRWVAWRFQSNFPNARLDFGAVPLVNCWPKSDTIRLTEH